MAAGFRLGAVLKLRERDETLAQRKLADARRVAAGIEDELRDLQRTSESAGSFMRDGHLSGPINLQLLASHRRYVNSVAVVGRERMRKLALARQAVEAARAELAEAAKRRMAIERLRDKAEARRRGEAQRRSAKVADEAAVQAAHRDRANGPA